MRSTWINIKTDQGQQELNNLLPDADVVVQNMRGLDKYGFGPEQVAKKRPGIIYLSNNCYGYGGPWGITADLIWKGVLFPALPKSKAVELAPNIHPQVS
jgi:crotonobetainyl-CoA:carnitine CoA-transferase CaiB-like acyl-CoA transferase